RGGAGDAGELAERGDCRVDPVDEAHVRPDLDPVHDLLRPNLLGGDLVALQARAFRGDVEVVGRERRRVLKGARRRERLRDLLDRIPCGVPKDQRRRDARRVTDPPGRVREAGAVDDGAVYHLAVGQVRFHRRDRRRRDSASGTIHAEPDVEAVDPEQLASAKRGLDPAAAAVALRVAQAQGRSRVVVEAFRQPRPPGGGPVLRYLRTDPDADDSRRRGQARNVANYLLPQWVANSSGSTSPASFSSFPPPSPIQPPALARPRAAMPPCALEAAGRRFDG